jgi:hypothetical protein
MVRMTNLSPDNAAWNEKHGLRVERGDHNVGIYLLRSKG